MMKELIMWYYQLSITNLQKLNNVYYTQLGDRYIYIISVGNEKNTIFFHLLQFLQYNPNQRVILSKDNTTTVLFEGKHYYVLESTTILHEYIDIQTLQIPIIYPEPFPVANHFKERWLNKNRLHEEQLNVVIEQLNPDNRSVLFDLATYYIHLNEQAYTLINELSEENYSVSLCHARLTPTTYKFEFFCPELLTLDNRSRCYCEYLRYLFLETLDLNQIHSTIQIINQVNPLTKAEWSFLNTRLYFPTQFYDALHSIRNDEPVQISALYEQALEYSKLLYQIPYEVYHTNSIELRTPEWIKAEVFNSV